MLRSFVAWLDSYISQRGVSAVLGGLVGLMAFAGLLGTVFGSQMIRAGGFIVVALLIVVGVLLVLADRRRLQRENNTNRNLLAIYCKFIVDHRPEPLVLVNEWNQTVFVQRNGDVREKLTIKAVALRKETHFIRFYAGSEWEQPEKIRDKVRVKARIMKKSGKAGPYCTVTKSWSSSRQMVMLVHLHTPVEMGAEIRLEINRVWPKKCQPLLYGEPDVFYFYSGKVLQIDRVKYRVVFPRNINVTYDSIGFRDDRSTGSYITSKKDDDGRRVVTLHIAHLPTHARYGMRLSIKQPAKMSHGLLYRD
ncbi:hypothetical protein [Amycolatopsis sp. BJA-103]|uniref:hypothetical protein n=1 Tax=Amycolatopsis sp. BJA-103 TaxID=1911175 RepID=UPI000C7742B2|nr:hypothetical protein [Amycolatopsis sp. BJA-103]AUI62309.1 hypothetical protein BKN51_31895 [Amycolatopsis sp. BJA-103]PNE20384.1 hypothetical protein B1H26_00525 [Amycolatopsis sp. BJA-103]